jgi:hypothetical protein
MKTYKNFIETDKNIQKVMPLIYLGTFKQVINLL